MGTYLKNSFIVTFIITVGQVLTAVLAGYAFAFLEFPFKRTLFLVFLATLMVPFEVTIVTNVATISSLGWYNTYAGLAVPFLATGFGAFLMRQAFLTLPHELRDAAALDGYGHWRFLWRVAVPLARPAVAALSVFAFLAAWNQYLWPLLITKDDRLRTVQIGLKQLQSLSIDQVNVDVRGRDHRGDPAGDPPPVLPEAPRAGPHRRRGQGLTPDPDAAIGHAVASAQGRIEQTGEWPCVRGSGSRVAGAAVGARWSAGLAVVRGAGVRARPRPTCPLSALKKATKPGADHDVALDDPRQRARRSSKLTDTVQLVADRR